MTTTPRLRRRLLGLEAVGSALFTLFTGLLLWRPDWIEVLLGTDPDAGSGAVEMALVAAPALVAAGLALLATRTWVRTARGRSPGPSPDRA